MRSIASLHENNTKGVTTTKRSVVMTPLVTGIMSLIYAKDRLILLVLVFVGLELEIVLLEVFLSIVLV